MCWKVDLHRQTQSPSKTFTHRLPRTLTIPTLSRPRQKKQRMNEWGWSVQYLGKITHPMNRELLSSSSCRPGKQDGFVLPEPFLEKFEDNLVVLPGVPVVYFVRVLPVVVFLINEKLLDYNHRQIVRQSPTTSRWGILSAKSVCSRSKKNLSEDDNERRNNRAETNLESINSQIKKALQFRDIPFTSRWVRHIHNRHARLPKIYIRLSL